VTLTHGLAVGGRGRRFTRLQTDLEYFGSLGLTFFLRPALLQTRGQDVLRTALADLPAVERRGRRLAAGQAAFEDFGGLCFAFLF
jgi:hypothetical protein